ncbi:MAG: type II toxin-antitoxin system death-on-curing family toxin [Vicinamibacterales bacterium]
MMRDLTLGEVVALHRRLIEQSGGASGLRDLGLLDSALAQPRATFDGVDLHATVVDKAAALCVSLIQNHPFMDGNKRIGHAAMATFLLLHGVEIVASVDEQERLMLAVASGSHRRHELAEWLSQHTKYLGAEPAV